MLRDDAYRLVQRSAMKVWESDGRLSLLELLKADPEVSRRIGNDELEEADFFVQQGLLPGLTPVYQHRAAKAFENALVERRPRLSTLSYTGPKKLSRLPKRSAVTPVCASCLLRATRNMR